MPSYQSLPFGRRSGQLRQVVAQHTGWRDDDRWLNFLLVGGLVTLNLVALGTAYWLTSSDILAEVTGEVRVDDWPGDDRAKAAEATSARLIKRSSLSKPESVRMDEPHPSVSLPLPPPPISEPKHPEPLAAERPAYKVNGGNLVENCVSLGTTGYYPFCNGSELLNLHAGDTIEFFAYPSTNALGYIRIGISKQ